MSYFSWCWTAVYPITCTIPGVRSWSLRRFVVLCCTRLSLFSLASCKYTKKDNFSCDTWYFNSFQLAALIFLNKHYSSVFDNMFKHWDSHIESQIAFKVTAVVTIHRLLLVHFVIWLQLWSNSWFFSLKYSIRFEQQIT